MTDVKDEICNDDDGALESLMDAMTREDELIVENERLRNLLRQWRLTADIAKDLTFVPVAIATDKVLGNNSD